MNTQAIPNGEDLIQNIVNETLGVEVPIHDKAPVSGGISVTSIGTERLVYWVWYNRRFRSRISSTIVVLIERVNPQNAQKQLKASQY